VLQGKRPVPGATQHLGNRWTPLQKAFLELVREEKKDEYVEHPRSVSLLTGRPLNSQSMQKKEVELCQNGRTTGKRSVILAIHFKGESAYLERRGDAKGSISREARCLSYPRIFTFYIGQR